MAGKDVREELAELTEAVRELRDREVADALRELRAEVERLRAERGAHSCHGPCVHLGCCAHAHCNWGHCGCFTWHGYGSVTITQPNISVTPYVVTTTGTTVSNFTTGYVNTAAGCNPATTMLSLSN